MALDDVVLAIADVLSGLPDPTGYPGADQDLTAPPARLPDDRVFVVYPDPGDAVVSVHQGGNGRAVYHADDDIRVDFYRRAARDMMAECEPEARAMLQATRDALFAAAKTSAFDRTIVGFAGIRTDLYGPLEYWLADTAFGFSLAVRVRHAVEVPA
jgi:hypothetical protein